MTWTLSRRRFVMGTAAALAAPAVVTAARAQSKTLYVNTYGGAWDIAHEAAFFKPFTDATGIEIKTVSPYSFAKLKAQVQSGSYEWDVTATGAGQWLRAGNEGLAEPIDWNIVDKDKLYPGAVYVDTLKHSFISTNLVYRADKFPNGGPKNWADFWDVEKFPGNRAMYSDAHSTLVFALLADGVPIDKVYPIDFDRAYKKLDEIKRHIKVWWSQGSQSQQLLRDGEVDMMGMWNARASDLKNQGTPVEIVWDGAHMTNTMWGVAKGAPNADIAWQFLQFASQAEPQAEFAKRLYYGPANPDSYALIPDEIARQLPSHPDNLARLVQADVVWEAPNLMAMNERFTQWLAS